MLNDAQNAVLAEWYTAQQKIAELSRQHTELQQAQEAERSARKRVVAALFPQAQEGTSTVQLGNNWILKTTVTYNREIDEPALRTLLPTLQACGVSTDNLFRWAPSLDLAVYRQLPGWARSLVDTVLTATPTMPTFKLVRPKEG